MKNNNAVICPPCGESVAVATKEGQNWEKTLWPLLPRLTAVLPVVNDDGQLVGVLSKEAALTVAPAKKSFWEKLKK